MDRTENRSQGRLQDKVAVITGGAGGIGRAAGALFAAEGASVLLVDLNEDALREAVRSIGSNRVSYCVADVTRAADNAAMFACAEERYGGVDVFLANAGIEGDVRSIVDYDEARFDQVMAVNVKGVFLGLKSAFPAMARRGAGPTGNRSRRQQNGCQHYGNGARSRHGTRPTASRSGHYRGAYRRHATGGT